jgi:hypothetical protein
MTVNRPKKDPGDAPPPVLRASEVGSYVFCARAWWYARRGVPSASQPLMETGERLHRQHGRLAGSARLVTILAFLLLAAAIGLIVVSLLYE